MIKAPFTLEQVVALNRFQNYGFVHPFTCGSGNRGDEAHSRYQEEHGGDHGQLVATEAGWVCPAVGCGYTQDWAHEVMLEERQHPFIDFISR